MSRPSSAVIPAARALHERLLNDGDHPDHDSVSSVTGAVYSDTTSPCDGCVDLAQLVIDAYATTWQGPRADQRERSSHDHD